MRKQILSLRMEQDINGISWKHLPWKKFQQKSFRLQRKIYEARCSGNSKVLLRFQKLLINSESIYYLAVRKVTEDYLDRGTEFSSLSSIGGIWFS